MFLEKRLLNKYGYVKDEKGRTVYRELNAGEEDISGIKKENPQYFPKADPRDKRDVAKAQPLVDTGGNLTSIINNKGQRVNVVDGSVLGAQPRRDSTAPNNTVSGIYQRQEDDYYAGNEALRNRVKAIESQTPKGMTYAEYAASGGKVTTPKGGAVSNPRQNANALINTNTAGMGESQLADLMRSINKAKEQLAMQIKSEGTAANLNNNNSASLAIGDSGQDTGIESLVDEVTQERNLAGADAQRNLLKKQLGLNTDVQEYQKERIIEERNRQEQDLQEQQARAKRDAVNLYFGGAGAPTNTTVAGIGESRAAQYDDLIQNVQNARADDLRQLDFDIRQGNLEAEALLMDFNMQERTAIVNEVQRRIAESQGIEQTRRETALAQLDSLREAGALTEASEDTLRSLSRAGGIDFGTVLALQAVERQAETVKQETKMSFNELGNLVATGEASPEEYEKYLKISGMMREQEELRRKMEMPNVDFQNIGGILYRIDKNTGGIEQLTNPTQDPTKLQTFQEGGKTYAFNPITGETKKLIGDGQTKIPTYGESGGGQVRTKIGGASGVITGYGSAKWAQGLDVVFDGGKGADVPAPVDGDVVGVGTKGGFGNTVLIKAPDGRIVQMAHLDSMNVTMGDKVKKGQPIGKQGNTGDVYSLSGGDGTHVDITSYTADENGKLTPLDVNETVKYLNVQDLGVPPIARLQELEPSGSELAMAEQILSGASTLRNVPANQYDRGRIAEITKYMHKANMEEAAARAYEVNSGFAMGIDQTRWHRYYLNGGANYPADIDSDFERELFKEEAETYRSALYDKIGAYSDYYDLFLSSAKMGQGYSDADIQRKMTPLFNAMINDDETEVKRQLANAIIGGIGEGTYDDFNTTNALIEDIYTEYENYVGSGGETGLLEGTMESVFNKLGSTNDPGLQRLRVKLGNLKRSYIKAVSGTAVTDQEYQRFSAEAASEFNNMALNKAQLEAFQDSIIAQRDTPLIRSLGQQRFNAIYNDGSLMGGAQYQNQMQQYINQALQAEQLGYEPLTLDDL